MLCGWPDRPRFDVVTGVSTGALQATFAFLGTKEDMQKLEKFYTDVEDDDIFDARGMLGLLTGNSINDPDGLWELIQANITPDVVKRVAAAYRDERRVLCVGTVNLDSGHFKPWVLTDIALCGDVERFQRAIFASACAPVIFSPVFMDKHMYVDGGAREQVFVRESLFALAEGWYGAQKGARQQKAKAWIVVNGSLGITPYPDHDGCVPDCGLDIVKRTLSVVLDEAMYGNLLRTEMTLKAVFEDQLEARYSWCPVPIEFDSFKFDRGQMKALFDHGSKWVAAKSWAEQIPPPIDDLRLNALRALR